jgi:2-(1,2-epoxy-1,2-dihydrophenyl)acetyl-CoA isomerase
MIDEGWFAIGAHWRVWAEPEAYQLLEDGRLQVQGTYRGTGRASGLPFEAAFVHMWELRDGRFAGLTQITNSAAFRDALGDAHPLGTIELSVDDGLAVLRLNRPDLRNAINQELADDFLVAARRLSRDTSVRAVLICGSGTDLTVGGDIDYITGGAGDDLGAVLRTMTTPFHLAFELLAELQVPIVTAARGAVAGGGIGFVYAADIVIAADNTRFVTAFAQIGLSGDGGGTWHLPRRIGPARAAAAYLLNEPISAAQALEWGLIAEVVADDLLDARALEVARRLANGPTRAYAAMRGLLRDSWACSLPDQLAAETNTLEATARTADAGNALAAFLARQTPTFQGR